MAVIQALQRVPGALVRNPIILVVFAAYGLLQLPQQLAQVVSPVLGGILSLVLLPVILLAVPFFHAGTLRMADEALDGRTSLGAFVQAGKANYVSMFGAYALVFAVSFVLGAVAMIIAVVGGVVALGSDAGLSTGAMVTLVVVGGVFVLAYLVFAFLVQFYGQEIVLNEASAIEALKQSAGLVRRNVLSTLGYYVVLLGVNGVIAGGLVAVMVFVLPSGTSGATADAAASSPTMIAFMAALFLVVVPVVSGAFTVYSVSFWRALRGTDARNGGAGAADATVA